MDELWMYWYQRIFLLEGMLSRSWIIDEFHWVFSFCFRIKTMVESVIGESHKKLQIKDLEEEVKNLKGQLDENKDKYTSNLSEALSTLKQVQDAVSITLRLLPLKYFCSRCPISLHWTRRNQACVGFYAFNKVITDLEILSIYFWIVVDLTLQVLIVYFSAIVTMILCI